MTGKLCSALFFLAIGLAVAAASAPAAAAPAPVAPTAQVLADGLAVNDPYLGTESWQFAIPRFPEAWEVGTGSASTVIAVLDTGIDRNHEDLGSVAQGYDFVNSDADPADDNGHGTAVAGIIAAQGANARGSAGVCWNCTIMPVKVLGADNSGTWTDVAEGIEWAIDQGAQVINMSFGLPTGSPVVAAAVRHARESGVILVASAGNGDSSSPSYPAAYEGVVSAAAVDESGSRYSASNGNVDGGGWGSNYGSWVDVDAPGCVASTWPGNRYTYFCGTSAAAPFVSGLAGLALSRTPTASPDAITDAVLSAARQGGASSAHGLIDAPATLDAIEALPPAQPAKISGRLGKRAFKLSQAAKVKLTYRFSAPSESFAYRLERKTAHGWKTVRGVSKQGSFHGTHSLTVKQLFGGRDIAAGRYRITLRADAGNVRVGFVAKQS